jgi:hypothetical protein
MKFFTAWRLIAPVLLLFSLSATPARAHHPTVGLGVGVAGPIVTVSAVPLEKGQLAFDLRQELVRFNEFSDAELIRFAEQEREVHSMGWHLSTSLGVAYGVADDLTVGLHLPYIYRQGIREAHHEEGAGVAPEVEDHGAPNGIGDLTLFGQYRFLHRPGSGLHAALLLGLKAPTGVDDRRTTEGVRFETEHQPGSGSWDPMLGLAVTRQMNRMSIDANLLYTLVTEGAQETDLGDAFLYNLALSWRLPEPGHAHESGAPHSHLALDLVLEANGESRAKQKIDGAKDPNSGGNLLYLSPGLRITAGGGLSAALSVGIPVWKDLNGEQSEPEYRTLLSVAAAF